MNTLFSVIRLLRGTLTRPTVQGALFLFLAAAWPLAKPTAHQCMTALFGWIDTQFESGAFLDSLDAIVVITAGAAVAASLLRTRLVCALLTFGCLLEVASTYSLGRGIAAVWLLVAAVSFLLFLRAWRRRLGSRSAGYASLRRALTGKLPLLIIPLAIWTLVWGYRHLPEMSQTTIRGWVLQHLTTPDAVGFALIGSCFVALGLLIWRLRETVRIVLSAPSEKARRWLDLKLLTTFRHFAFGFPVWWWGFEWLEKTAGAGWHDAGVACFVLWSLFNGYMIIQSTLELSCGWAFRLSQRRAGNRELANVEEPVLDRHQ